ncbi:MAG: hypothetical protein IPJ13_19600 [Saprospiraceae bacterium]|nr:hypothetical protein [Saprospiraceae bacterium]
MMSTVTGDLVNYFFNAKYAIAILEEENHNIGHEKKSEDELIEPKLTTILITLQICIKYGKKITDFIFHASIMFLM